MSKSIALICEAGPKPTKWLNNKTTPASLARRGRTWTLVLDEYGLRLFDHEGVEVVAIARDDLESAFRFPSVLDPEDVRNLGIVTAEETYWFQPDRAAIALIRADLDEAIVRQGPEALETYRRWARKQFLVGSMGLIGGPLAAYMGWRLIGGRHVPGKLYGLLVVVAVMGIMQFVRGCRAMLRLRGLRALEEEETWRM